MAKEDLIELEGTVTEALPGGKFDVDVGGGNHVWAYPSGKLKVNSIRILVGDKVTVCVSPYDMSKGRIIWRHKN